MESNSRSYGGLIWPVILIGAGVIFLLNTLNILDWSVWNSLLRLWPVLLVAVGLEILIGRRSRWGSVLVALLLVGVLAAAVIWAAPAAGRVSSASYVDRTESISEDLGGASKAAIDLAFGTGNLVVGALPAGSPKLIEGTVDLSRREDLEAGLRGSGDNARYTLKSTSPQLVGAEVIDQAEEKVWDLQVSRDIPLALSVSTGVGKSTLDLSNLSLTQLNVNGGLGQVTVRLPARGRYGVSVDGGVGELILILPEDLGARIRIDGGLGATEVTGDFERGEDQYTTPGFSSAESRAEIEIDGGLGRVQIRRAEE